mgnify:CR=1 FL=1
MKRILLICAFLFALAVQAGAQSKQQQQQPVEVNGLVVDSDDVPIVGATVYIKDEPGIGSITNSEGRFKLTAKMYNTCLLYTSPSPRDVEESRMPSSA